MIGDTGLEFLFMVLYIWDKQNENFYSADLSQVISHVGAPGNEFIEVIKQEII